MTAKQFFDKLPKEEQEVIKEKSNHLIDAVRYVHLKYKLGLKMSKDIVDLFR
ncbi:MAG: hypothetical protein AB8G11_08340 [Saprospiraceae bacterium]